ncbi:gamma-glutamylcyclotransferase [Mitsuaria sp. GD03876]|uniref:gamma-glutamylcyclotransferase family protein n=1 Tax=Mitsuaria sp. GD03876 TaxID=2975399 RepID=UPI002446A1AD|nr:gamma-glutamylcyclotransferase [Mitsuaria sp. GD03876]MDH0865420.1 gamma-glutamylcyclotransferase [Mitsuaria sp. GD03876]
MAHVFTYGTLMWPDIMARVCGEGGSPFAPPLAATLADHARHPVRGHDYPAMIPSAGHQVVGRLYLDVPEAAWARLDRFEGADYERHEVLVTLADGSWRRAWTYLFRPAPAERLDAGDWDEARFEREGKARFVARYAGFGAL